MKHTVKMIMKHTLKMIKTLLNKGIEVYNTLYEKYYSLDWKTRMKIRKVKLQILGVLLVCIGLYATSLYSIKHQEKDYAETYAESSTELRFVPVEPEDDGLSQYYKFGNKELKTSSVLEENTSTESDVSEIEYKFPLTKKEWKIFYRIVEAEVTGDSYPGCTEEELRLAKRHVADVIINRMLDDRFENSDMETLIFSKNQFQPTWDGRYWKVEITSMTKEVVREAMLSTSEDTTDGAVFFCRGNMPDRTFLFKDAVGHRFYK